MNEVIKKCLHALYFSTITFFLFFSITLNVLLIITQHSKTEIHFHYST